MRTVFIIVVILSMSGCTLTRQSVREVVPFLIDVNGNKQHDRLINRYHSAIAYIIIKSERKREYRFQFKKRNTDDTLAYYLILQDLHLTNKIP